MPTGHPVDLRGLSQNFDKHESPCCMICFIGLGWVGSGGSELGCCVSGCGCRGATDIESVSCHLFRLGVLCLLGVLWLTCVTCAQLTVLDFCGGIWVMVVWLGCLHLVGVFCPLDVTCA